MPECDARRRHRRDQQAESARRLAMGSEQPTPLRPSVEAMQAHYDTGAGFDAAVREAEHLLAAGFEEDRLMEEIGFPPTSRRALAEAKRRAATRSDANAHLRALARELSRRAEDECAA